tara:strand:+ start:116 stop:541 length:426 start_codon:yes stop_codon:yes gene_type:complete
MSKSIEKSFVIIVLTGLLFSCNMIGEKVIDRGLLKVYFAESTDEKIAVRFADFWIDRKYVGERPQNIKITEDLSSEVFQIRLILREDFKSSTKINFDELKLLGQIQHELNSNVFDKKKCELVICDNKFQTINTPIPLYSNK